LTPNIVRRGELRPAGDHAPERWCLLNAVARWATIKYFDEEIERILQSSVLHPIPNSEPKLAMLGLHFALHTAQGRPVRCFINREVFDDRVQRNPAVHVLNCFRAGLKKKLSDFSEL